MNPSYLFGGIFLVALAIAGSAYLIYLYINSSNLPPASKTELFTDSTRYCKQQCYAVGVCPATMDSDGGSCSCDPSSGRCMYCSTLPCNPGELDCNICV